MGAFLKVKSRTLTANVLLSDDSSLILLPVKAYGYTIYYIQFYKKCKLFFTDKFFVVNNVNYTGNYAEYCGNPKGNFTYKAENCTAYFNSL